MFAIPAAIIGAVLGWLRAAKAGGNRLDKLQYAAVHAIIFFLIALALTVLADWQGWI